MFSPYFLRQGGGSGGGDDGNNTVETADGVYEIAANQLTFLTRPPKDGTPGPHVITILASGNTLRDGKVDVRGSQGVRITSGPPLVGPAATSKSTQGVQIIVPSYHKVTIQHGLSTDPGVPDIKTIQMDAEGIFIECGDPETGPSLALTSDSLDLNFGPDTQISMNQTGIDITAGFGNSCISLDADGTVSIDGLSVQINGASMVGINSTPPTPPDPPDDEETESEFSDVLEDN